MSGNGNGNLAPRGPLGDLETRIRLALDQEGTIPLDLERGVSVSLTGPDLNLPGMSSRRGRRWAWANQTAAASAGFLVATLSTGSLGILVEGVAITCRVGPVARVWGRVMDAATTLATVPGMLGAPNVLSIDNKLVSSGSELPACGGIAAVGGTAMPADGQFAFTPALNVPVVLPLEVFLAPGQGVQFSGVVSALTEFDFSYWGRLF